MGHNLEARKAETTIHARAIHCLYLIHTHIKLHKDIVNS